MGTVKVSDLILEISTESMHNNDEIINALKSTEHFISLRLL